MAKKRKKTKKSKVIKMYRVSRWFYKKRIPLFPNLIRKMIRFFFSADIPFTADIDKTVEFKHGGLGVVIHDKSTIGKNSVIYQHVTIGGREGRGHPTIGENVYIGAGACVLGGVKVGDNVMIAANAVVIEDIPSNTTVVGVPAKPVKK